MDIGAERGEERNGDRWIEVDPPGYESEPALAYVRGTYWYKPGAWVPYKVVRGTDDHGSVTTLTRAEYGEGLPEITGHKLANSEGTIPSTRYPVYAGDNADLFGTGWTVRDAYKELLDQQPSVDAALRDGACVYESYHLFHEAERVPALVSDRTITTIFHIMDRGGTAEKWIVRWYRYGELSPDVKAWEETSDRSDLVFSCSEIARSPPMTHSMDHTWAAARPIFGECFNQLSAWYRAHHVFSDDQDPTTGWGHTSILKTDGLCEGGTGFALSRPFMVDAHTGWMTNIRPSFEEYRVWEPNARDPAERLHEP